MIGPFRGKYAFLSNFCPCRIKYDGKTYPSVEHAYQASKTISLVERKAIMACSTPGKAKKLGKLLTLRPDWEDLRTTFMCALLFLKFEQSPFKGQILATGDEELVELNNWGDQFWGVCGGRGENYLGRALMEVRDKLKKERRPK